MSLVTTVVLITGINDNINFLDTWFNNLDLHAPMRVDQLWEYDKRCRANIYIGAYNYFPNEKEFLEKVFSYPWRYPQEVLLVIRRFEEQKIYQQDRFSNNWAELTDNA